MGCATGEFLYYLQKQFPKSQCAGIDVSNDMIAFARKKMPHMSWICEDILTRPQTTVNQNYDIVTCVGVLQIFDDILTPVTNW